MTSYSAQSGTVFVLPDEQARDRVVPILKRQVKQRNINARVSPNLTPLECENKALIYNAVKTLITQATRNPQMCATNA